MGNPTRRHANACGDGCQTFAFPFVEQAEGFLDLLNPFLVVPLLKFTVESYAKRQGDVRIGAFSFSPFDFLPVSNSAFECPNFLSGKQSVNSRTHKAIVRGKVYHPSFIKNQCSRRLNTPQQSKISELIGTK